jgi:hypothetical protein
MDVRKGLIYASYALIAFCVGVIVYTLVYPVVAGVY